MREGEYTSYLSGDWLLALKLEHYIDETFGVLSSEKMECAYIQPIMEIH